MNRTPHQAGADPAGVAGPNYRRPRLAKLAASASVVLAMARLTFGIDLSRPFSRALGIKADSALDASIGARWERNWSNGADKRYERGFIVPALSVSTNF